MKFFKETGGLPTLTDQTDFISFDLLPGIENEAGIWKGTFIWGESPSRTPPPIHFFMTKWMWKKNNKHS